MVNIATNIPKIIKEIQILKIIIIIFLVLYNIDLYICIIKIIISQHNYRTDLTVKRKAMPEAVRRQIQTRLEKSKGADAEKL